MKANLTRGNSITEFQDFIEDYIYQEIKQTYWNEWHLLLLKRQAEILGPSEPAGILHVPESMYYEIDGYKYFTTGGSSEG